MTLKDLLSSNEVHIEYRTHLPDGTDVLSGFCHWDGENLYPLDNDDYSVDDVIESYEWDNNKNLIVWYESRWITG